MSSIARWNAACHAGAGIKQHKARRDFGRGVSSHRQVRPFADGGVPGRVLKYRREVRRRKVQQVGATMSSPMHICSC
eukprot:3164289-Pyramimonas_sp.AAC.2